MRRGSICVTAWRLFREIGDAVNVASCVMSLACYQAALNTEAAAIQAARLFGLADRLLSESGGTLEAADRHEADQYRTLVRVRLSDRVFEEAWQLRTSAVTRRRSAMVRPLAVFSKQVTWSRRTFTIWQEPVSHCCQT